MNLPVSPVKRAKARCVLTLLASALVAPATFADPFPKDWPVAAPESQGMLTDNLRAIWKDLQQRKTNVFLVARNDHIVFERYAEGFSRTKPHYTASMAKALVGGTTLMLAMSDGRIRPDDRASKFVPAWADVPLRRDITVRQLATHTSGLEDARDDSAGPAQHSGSTHALLTGWKGEFWKYPKGPIDAFTISRDQVPVASTPGTKEDYSNCGMAMLAYCVTASLRGAPQTDLRTLMRQRVMDPIGVPAKEWDIGYGTTTNVDGLPLVANWGGAGFSANATARLARLWMRRGDWEEKQLISAAVVEEATRYAGGPNRAGLGFWVNRQPDGSRFWPNVPDDAFWGSGAGDQFVFVVPSLNLIVVRNGNSLDNDPGRHAAEGHYIVNPIMAAFTPRLTAAYPPSEVIKEVRWAPKESIVRKAPGSDNWPMAWADDGEMYSAYGDGNGFAPFVKEKLSMGFVKVSGSPAGFRGENIRSSSGETIGDDVRGKKASGMIMVDGVLYLLARNAGNAQLGWSADHAKTWTWADWKFTSSFGCPTFLEFGRDYAGARDEFVYIYSQDNDSAYQRADGIVLARVPKPRVRERAAYEFFVRTDVNGQPVWSRNIAERGPVFVQRGACYRARVTYDAGLKRYLLNNMGLGNTRSGGGFAIYDAPEPWGPWTTAFFTENWDVGPGDTTNFPSKWISDDGRAAWLVFAGDDNFCVRQATFVVADRAAK